jgi:deferrochelatase/peroxidase EfeB
MAQTALRLAAVTPARSVELEDIQGLVRFAYKNHTEAVFLLLQVQDAAAAAAWLARAPVESALPRSPPPATALQVALTSSGLRALGVAESIIEGFSQEFVVGMAADPNRSRRLGDVGANDPCHWQWGSGPALPHAVVLLYAVPGKLLELQRTIEAGLAGGFEITHRLNTSNMGGVEPFGFVDGISQPELDWGRRRVARDLTELKYLNLSCLGEYLLGYPNEYGLYTTRPLLDPSPEAGGLLPRAEESPGKLDVGRNGSYLVVRQLRQNVPAFWQALDRYAGGAADLREQLASDMVGRRLDGAPLMRPASPPSAPGSPPSPNALNQFDYGSDPQGLRCPLAAHIRRANPRNADYPPKSAGLISRLTHTLGFDSVAREQDLIASTRFHRILRRGREYGVKMTPTQALSETPGSADRGLQFVCLGASLQRQFEFVQSAWLVSAKFNGLREQADPLLGNRQPLAAGTPTNCFSVPQTAGPSRRLTGLPQFVTVLGGAYFFLPGIRALRFLAGGRR